MPYKSKAQARKFHADPSLQGMAPHWDEETKKKKGGFKALPEKAKGKKSQKAKKGKDPNQPRKPNKPTTNKSKQRRIFEKKKQKPRSGGAKKK